MASPIERFKSAYNAFMGRAPTTTRSFYYGSATRQDKIRRRIQNERSIINSIYNRIAVDAASIDIRHVRIDQEGKYEKTLYSSLNRVLSREANVDQTGRAMIEDLVYSMLDEGCVALFPAYTNVDPTYTDSYEILEARVGKVVEWGPYSVRIEAYNDVKGQKEEAVILKKNVPIIENPFFSIMNEPNSTMQRLIRVLNQLDKLNDQNAAGKIDLIIQLPYPMKSEARIRQAEERRKNIEAQLSGGAQYGIAYIDDTEKVIQLNRSVENTLWEEAKELKQELFDQMGMTMEILNGTANEETMINYYSRIIEPILTAIVEEIERKWISKTAQTQGQAIRFFRDPFKLIPVSKVAELSDKLTRNEIMTSNEIRTKLGLMPSSDPKADKLINSNINQPEEKVQEKSDKAEEKQAPGIQNQ